MYVSLWTRKRNFVEKNSSYGNWFVDKWNKKVYNDTKIYLTQLNDCIQI